MKGTTILHVHVPTLLHGSDSHLVVATVIGEDSRLHDQKSEQKKIRTELINWFGSDAKIGLSSARLRRLRPSSGGTTATGRERQSLIQDGIYCIGDHTMHPSVQGTLRSVERLLEHLEIPIPMKG